MRGNVIWGRSGVLLGFVGSGWGLVVAEGWDVGFRGNCICSRGHSRSWVLIIMVCGLWGYILRFWLIIGCWGWGVSRGYRPLGREVPVTGCGRAILVLPSPFCGSTATVWRTTSPWTSSKLMLWWEILPGWRSIASSCSLGLIMGCQGPFYWGTVFSMGRKIGL